jgi:hypothetical protein
MSGAPSDERSGLSFVLKKTSTVASAIVVLEQTP